MEHQVSLASRLVAVVVCTVASAAHLPAADLAKIDRTIAKEPTYQSTPKYCLLVFGPEAKTRVWLVHDGERLYIDRNGNGDLTELGETVAAKKGGLTDPAEGIFYFEAGDIRDGTLTHKGLRLWVSKLDDLAKSDEGVKAYLAKDPKARRLSLGLDVQVPGRKGLGLGSRVEHVVSFRDAHGLLRFGDTPLNAPIIHFRGPWHVTLYEWQTPTIGRESELFVAVGTPGLGPGTTAYFGYEGVIPTSAYPKVEVTYPPRRSGEASIKEHYELKYRC